jgi:hypothetical protein
MTRTPLIRRATLTLTAAGLAVLGGVLTAPAASAAPGHAQGPDVFIQLEHGVMPVFFCDEDQPKKQHNICKTLTGPRF